MNTNDTIVVSPAAMARRRAGDNAERGSVVEAKGFFSVAESGTLFVELSNRLFFGTNLSPWRLAVAERRAKISPLTRQQLRRKQKTSKDRAVLNSEDTAVSAV